MPGWVRVGSCVLSSSLERNDVMNCSDCMTYCCSRVKTEISSAGEATGCWYGRLSGSQVSLAAWSCELVATLDVGGDRGGLLATLSFVNVGSVLGLVLGFLAGAASTGAGAKVLTQWMRGGVNVLVPREALRLDGGWCPLGCGLNGCPRHSAYSGAVMVWYGSLKGR